MPLKLKNPLPQANYNWEWEPRELRDLKLELANLKCDCDLCKHEPKKIPANKGIQADNKYYMFDRCIQVSPESVFEEIVTSRIANQQCTDLVCPRCMVAMNFLQAGVTRIVKDEEIETNTMVTLEKNTGRAWNTTERTCSTIKNVKLDVSSKEKNTNTMRSSSAVTKSQSGSSNFIFNVLSTSSSETDQIFKQTNRDKVTFMDSQEIDGFREKEKRQLQCTCLEELIDSIRPPLVGF